MNLPFKVVSLITMIAGLALAGVGWSRDRLSYENGRHFDPQTAIVYHQQTAEVFLIAGVALTIVGPVFAGVAFRGRFLRSQ